MPSPLDSKLTVNFERLGFQETIRIGDWRIESSYLTSTDAFSFVLLPDFTDPRFRDLELEPVELLLNGFSQLKGRIEKTTIGDNGSEVECEGRDYLSDLVEGNVDPKFRAKESMTLGEAVLGVTEPYGTLAVLGDDDVAMQNIRMGFQARRKKRRKKTTVKLQDYDPRPTEGDFAYINRLAARHGTTVQPAMDRQSILLNAPDYDQEPTYTIHVTADKRAGTQNNVISARAVRDYTKFPTYTIANGKQARSAEKPSGITRTYNTLDVIANLGNPELQRILSADKIMSGRQPVNVPNDQIAPKLYRLLHVEDIDARNDDQLDHAALRAIADRLKDTLDYTVTLRGHVDPDSNAIWSVNTMVHVIDEIRGIDEPLWIAEANKFFSSRNGATTQIRCWRPDSFQIEQHQ